MATAKQKSATPKHAQAAGTESGRTPGKKKENLKNKESDHKYTQNNVFLWQNIFFMVNISNSATNEKKAKQSCEPALMHNSNACICQYTLHYYFLINFR